MPRTNLEANPLFAGRPATQIEAQDLHIVSATDAADATVRSVPQLTTVLGMTATEHDAISVASTVIIDGRTLSPGLWYFPVTSAAGAATVNDLVYLSAAEANVGIGAVLPDPALAGALAIFLLHSQALEHLNGVYERIGTTHYTQRLREGSSQQFGAGTALPSAAAASVSWFLLFSQTPPTLGGWYEKQGTTHWTQRSSSN